MFIEFNLHEKVISLIVIKFDSKINYNVELHDLDNSVAYNSENYFSAQCFRFHCLNVLSGISYAALLLILSTVCQQLRYSVHL